MSAFTRMLRRHGEDWTIKGWAESSRDDYEDELATAPTTSTFKAIRGDIEGQPEAERDEKGHTRWERLELLVDSDLTLPDQTDETLTVTLISADGREYSLVGVNKTGVPVGAKRLSIRTGGGDAALYF